MKGKRAKEIYRTARNVLMSVGVQPDDGYGKYRQAKNCNTWEPVIISNKVIRDQDGQPLLRPALTYGTVYNEHKVRLFYRFLKRLYKRDIKNYNTILANIVMEMRRNWLDSQKKELKKASAKGV